MASRNYELKEIIGTVIGVLVILFLIIVGIGSCSKDSGYSGLPDPSGYTGSNSSGQGGLPPPSSGRYSTPSRGSNLQPDFYSPDADSVDELLEQRKNELMEDLFLQP